MWKPVVQSFDWLLSTTLARSVRPPESGIPNPADVPDTPDEVDWPEGLDIAFTPVEGKPPLRSDAPQRRFSFASPLASPWDESRTARGLAIGPPEAEEVALLLHGAYEDSYGHIQWMADAFVQHGYRAMIPAAPCHLERAPADVFSGAPIFWSAQLVVTALHQWLAEIRGLIGQLRGEGVKTVGLCGVSLGSLAAGLAATLWDDLDFVALIAPVGSHRESIEHSRLAQRIWPWMKELSAEDAALLDRWAPVKRASKVERLGYFITLYDRLQPTALQQQWWQAWGKPPQWTYRHAHLSVNFSRRLHRDLAEFAVGAGERTS